MPAQHSLVMQSSRVPSKTPGRVPFIAKSPTRLELPAGHNSPQKSHVGFSRTVIRFALQAISMARTNSITANLLSCFQIMNAAQRRDVSARDQHTDCAPQPHFVASPALCRGSAQHYLFRGYSREHSYYYSRYYL